MVDFFMIIQLNTGWWQTCLRAHCYAQETATHIVLQFQAIRLMKGIGFSYY